MTNLGDFDNQRWDKPLVSICILTYNHEKFVRKAIDSFLMQKVNFGVEIVIHDDASEDLTQDILKDYANRYPSIFNLLLQSENQRSKFGSGMNPRFNYPRVKGEYIVLCEGDDYWTDSSKLQKQVDYLKANSKISGVFHETQILELDKFRPFRINLPQVVNTKMMFSEVIPFHTSSIMFRTEDISNYPDAFTNFASGDFLLFFWLSLKGDLHKVEIKPSVYRKHSGGVTQSSVHKSVEHQLNRMKMLRFFNDYADGEYKEQYNKVLLVHIFKILKFSNIGVGELISEFIRRKKRNWKHWIVKKLKY